MPGEREILRFLSRQPKQTASFKQMLREMGARGQERHDLKDELKRLTDEGMLVESRGQIFSMARGADFVAGRLVRHRDGYGFVIPDEPLPKVAGDVYIDAYGMRDAMHGDHVLVKLGSVDERGRASGKIQKILERVHATLVGQFHVARTGNYVAPADERVREEILIPPNEPLPGGVKPEDIDGTIVD